MTTAVAVIDMAERRASAFIRRGQRAWGEIKKTAEEQRTLWLEVGVALMYGKQKENRAEGQKFSDWREALFPGLADKTASDAIWWASNSGVTPEIPAGLSHPENIRKWANEQQATQALPEDLQSVSVASTLVMPQRDAERAVKTILRAASGDEGSETATRHVKAMAQKVGATVEEFTQAAINGSPDSYFRLAPTVQLQLDEFRDTLRTSVREMQESDISIDAIKAIFIHFANTL